MLVQIPEIENFCANSCFVVLFLTTIYYWSRLIFADVAANGASWSTNSIYDKTGLFGCSSALFFITLQLLLRWLESGHFPLSNLYESLLFLSWCILGIYIYIEKSIKTLFLGILICPTVLLLFTFTSFILPSELQQSTPLVPALQSNWLIMHVTVMIASYASLLLGCFLAIGYLIFASFFVFPESQNIALSQLVEKNNLDCNPMTSKNMFLEPIPKQNNLFTKPKTESLAISAFSSETPQKGMSLTNSWLSRDRVLNFLDNLSYRTIGIGFCFLTLGILSGAVWANETWGSYWSWDPKETWAFITWLTFAIYLHTRLIGGWSGNKSAWIASLGFVIIWVCYLGVNILGQGLHSYGFLKI